MTSRKNEAAARDINSCRHGSFPGALISRHRGGRARLVGPCPTKESLPCGKRRARVSLRCRSGATIIFHPLRISRWKWSGPLPGIRGENALNIAVEKIRVLLRAGRHETHYALLLLSPATVTTPRPPRIVKHFYASVLLVRRGLGAR